ncbi:hypothetical protein VM57_19655 [Stenotrophomonas maltophilia]|uniref:Uncharacterized protein n=1 Tax=Stenotrophomonas maltophilia TaxID=40324 RepID=A0A0F5ZM56_STEMA|nr:hypothetical protein VM57_19655 [Stenotrophomonas maltophilia]
MLGHLHRAAAAHAVAGGEAHFGAVGAGDGVLVHGQAQPMRTLAGRIIQRQLGRTGIRMPALAQIVRQPPHIGAVTRSHQVLGIGGGLTGMERPQQAAYSAGRPQGQGSVGFRLMRTLSPGCADGSTRGTGQPVQDRRMLSRPHID